MKLNEKTHGDLIRAWETYGHAVDWRRLDAKFAPHGYVALAWDVGDGQVEYADLSLVDHVWEMQNDSCGPIPLADWKRAKIPAECDWLTVDGKVI